MSLRSPSIQQRERQMYFYWADYPRAHCPAVRNACASAPLKSVSTVAVCWVMFMRFSDFLPPSWFSTYCTVYQHSGEFDSGWQPLLRRCSSSASAAEVQQNSSLRTWRFYRIMINKIHQSHTVLLLFLRSKLKAQATILSCFIQFLRISTKITTRLSLWK